MKQNLKTITLVVPTVLSSNFWEEDVIELITAAVFRVFRNQINQVDGKMKPEEDISNKKMRSSWQSDENELQMW